MCTSDTGSYYVGETWTCPDGCNTCSCEADGSIVSTEIACVATCTDETGSYVENETWLCPDGCNTCSCEPGGTISATEMTCG